MQEGAAGAVRSGAVRSGTLGVRGALVVAAVLGAAGCAQARSATPSEIANVSVDSAASTVVLDVGPVSLDPLGGSRSMLMAQPITIALPVSGWLRGMSADVVDASGRLLPRQVLHHVNVIAPELRELFSPIMLRIGAAGAETAPIELPRMLGYRVTRGDSLVVTAMLDNPTAQPLAGVHVRVRLHYTPADSWLHPISVFPFYLDVTPPAGVHAYDLPPGHSERSWTGQPAIAGRILGLGGHLHEYGTELRLEDVTAHELLWAARPAVDSTGRVTGMPTQLFLTRLGLPVYPDHKYRLTAVYDNPTGRTLRDGAMGALGGIILPGDARKWPSVARQDAQYREDQRVTYDTSVSMMDMMDMKMTPDHPHD